MEPISQPQLDSFDKQTCASQTKQQAYEFIKAHRAAALATADDTGKPHVAIIYCLATQELSMYFSTRVESRKFHNIIKRPVVSVAFSDEAQMATIQMTAVAKRVNSLQIEQAVLHDLILLRYGEPNWPVPPVKMFERGSTNELAIIKLTPLEMTYGRFEAGRGGRYKPFFETVI